MKLLLSVFIILGSVSAFGSDVSYVKDGDPTIVLKINEADSTAKVIKREYYIDVTTGETREELKEKAILVRGSLVTDNNSDFRIEREEGEVCPAVSVYMLHDIQRGENEGALVRVIEEEGGTANKYCNTLDVNGQYSKQ